jgi:hypothetical protein
MGAKEDLLSDIIRKDNTGGVRRIHELLIGCGLKYKGPKNSQTLLYYFRNEGKEVGVAAMRQSIFSFPATFWSLRAAALRSALARVPGYQQRATEPAISSSQYSAGQIAMNQNTISEIESIIRDLIIPLAREAGATLA